MTAYDELELDTLGDRKTALIICKVENGLTEAIKAAKIATALDIEPATIDEIVVFTSKKGEDYE